MLIEQIDETNFLEKNEEGRKRVELKIKRFENQIKKATEDESKRGRFTNPSNKDSVDWYQLYDPTIWAYKHLRDKQNNPLLLRGFQDSLINDKHRFVACVAANQIGKTWTACIKALHHATFVNNASVLILSRSEPQAIMILDEIKWMMKRAQIPFDTVIGDVENRTELHLNNADNKGTSVIRCLPPTLAALAYPATLIIPDEEDFWEIDGMTQIEYFQRVVLSRIFETKNWKNNCICGNDCNHFIMGQIFAISNPNMEGGILWSQYNDPDFHAYRFNYLANSSNTLEEYNKAKEKLPSDIFNSTMAAVFSSASGGFITEQEWNDAMVNYIPIPSEQFYLGGDFAGEDTKGRDLDHSVLAGVELFIKRNPFIQKIGVHGVKVCYLKEFPIRTKKEEIYTEISTLKQQIIKFAYDKVGVGDSVKNDLKDLNLLSENKIEALTYSLPNKSEVYYNLKHLFEQRKIIVPNNQKLKEQLLGLRFERTEGGYIKIHHKTESFKDDLADSLANACYAATILKGTPVEAIFIPHTTRKEAIKSNKGDLLFCLQCNDYHWTSEPHIEITI